MRVLFVDIDGVLNTNRTPVQMDGSWLLMMDPEKVFLLNNLVDKHGFQVVLSSAWRHKDDWREEMRANGLLFTFLDRTPTDFNLMSRGEEIQAWLDTHPEVERYAIIDDDRDMLPSQLPNFFKTLCTRGLTPEIAEAVEKHLLCIK